MTSVQRLPSMPDLDSSSSSSESASFTSPIWRNDSLLEAVESVNLTFRRDIPLSDLSDDDDDDEVEFTLPDIDEPVIATQPRMKTSNVGIALRWAAQRVLTIDEQVRLDAASALLAIRARSASRVADRSVSTSSELADNLSNIFSLANAELQQQMQQSDSAVSQDHEKFVMSQSVRRNQFRQQAEASIADFLNEQKRLREDEERREREAEQAQQEQIRLQVEAQKEAEAAQAAVVAEQQAQLELNAHVTAIENDTTTLWPTERLQSAASLRRFCSARAKFFKEMFAKVGEAPYDPDQKQFLAANQLIGKFVPNVEAVPGTVSELSKILSSSGASSDLHYCNFASSFLKQVQNKVFQSPELAIGFERLWTSLGQHFPRLSLFIMAGAFHRCPAAALKLDDPSRMPTPLQAGSLRALLRVFCGFLQSVEESSLEFAWMWISAVSSTSPTTAMTAPCLLMFLEISQLTNFRFFIRYGAQGRKLIRFISRSVVPSLRNASGALDSDIENLKVFFDMKVLKSTPERAYILDCLQRTS